MHACIGGCHCPKNRDDPHIINKRSRRFKVRTAVYSMEERTKKRYIFEHKLLLTRASTKPQIPDKLKAYRYYKQ